MHHFREGLDQAAVRIPHQARIAGESQQPRHRGIAQPDVEHRFHHAGHRHRRARAHRDEQRLARAAELQAGRQFETVQLRREHDLQSGGQSARTAQVVAAIAGVEDQCVRNRQPESRHAPQVVALETERLGYRALDRAPAP